MGDGVGRTCLIIFTESNHQTIKFHSEAHWPINQDSRDNPYIFAIENHLHQPSLAPAPHPCCIHLDKILIKNDSSWRKSTMSLWVRPDIRSPKPVVRFSRGGVSGFCQTGILSSHILANPDAEPLSITSLSIRLSRMFLMPHWTWKISP